jgi:hypothetical protein
VGEVDIAKLRCLAERKRVARQPVYIELIE